MFRTLSEILGRTVEQLSRPVTLHAPQVLASAVLLAATVLVAGVVRWLLQRLVRARALERFLLQSGLCDFLPRSGKIRAARLIADAAFWALIVGGALLAVSAIDSSLTSSFVESSVRLLPKIVTAGAIVLAGAWLARYFSRGVVVWACNEGIRYPRRLAAGVRVLVTFAAVVMAANELEFARTIFIAAFLIVFGGLMLAASIAAGISARELLKRHLDRPAESDPAENGSLWRHV